MALNFFKCPICGIQKYMLDKYLKHLQFAHQNHNGFRVACRLNGCPKTYTSVKSLREHMRKKHTEIYTDANDPCNNQENHDDQQATTENIALDNFEDFEPESDSDVEASVPINSSFTMNDLAVGLQKHIALFILQVGEQHAIPTVVQENIAEEVRFFLLFHF